MIDLHQADLQKLSFQDVISWLEASAVETQRLDFKEILNPEAVVESACAFANAYGGIIVVGFKDPDKAKGQLQPTELALDLTDKALLRVNNKLVDSIRPNFKFEIVRFPQKLDSSTKPTFGLIRIPASAVAPHELLSKHFFPIRRDRRNDRMTLIEIETMLRRREGLPVNAIGGESTLRLP
jgi:predicted HTH transcriptional regulator